MEITALRQEVLTPSNCPLTVSACGIMLIWALSSLSTLICHPRRVSSRGKEDWATKVFVSQDFVPAPSMLSAGGHVRRTPGTEKRPKVKVRSRTDRCDMRKDNQKRISRPNLLIMAFPSVFRGSDPGIVTSDDRESSGRKSPGTLLLVVSEVNCRYLTVSWRRSTGKHSSQISART